MDNISVGSSDQGDDDSLNSLYGSNGRLLVGDGGYDSSTEFAPRDDVSGSIPSYYDSNTEFAPRDDASDSAPSYLISSSDDNSNHNYSE
jgi:hypothetical protein